MHQVEFERTSRRLRRGLMARPARAMLIAWARNCLGLAIAALIVPAIGFGGELGTLLLAGAILGLANLALRPLVILLTLPAVILTLGFALLFVNALMLWVTAAIVPGLAVGGFWSLLGGAVLISATNLILRRSQRRQDRRGSWWFTGSGEETFSGVGFGRSLPPR